MIFLSCHSYLHVLDDMRLGSVEQLRFHAYSHQPFQYLSVCWIQFQKMAVQNTIVALHLF